MSKAIFGVCAALCVCATGCSADNLSRREAEQTFDAVTEVANVVIVQAREAVEDDKQGNFSVEANGVNFELEGSLEDESGFSGSVLVTGAASQSGDDFDYDVTASFDALEADTGVVLDGDLALTFFARDVGGIDLSFAVGSSLDGELQVSGSASGIAEIRYDLEFALDGLDVSLTAEGEISGHDVSGWDDLTISL